MEGELREFLEGDVFVRFLLDGNQIFVDLPPPEMRTTILLSLGVESEDITRRERNAVGGERGAR